MTTARLLSGFKQLFTFYWQFGAGFVVGSIYVAALITIPRLLALATRLL